MTNDPTPADVARWSKWDNLRMRKELATTDEEREKLAHEEDDLRDEGIRELLMQDVSHEPQWFWLSFADPSLPEGEQFLGVSIVKAGGVMEASLIAKAKGCNPGGEVLAYPISPEFLPGPEWRERLLTKQEALEVQAP